jgi:hypothetical protein
MAKATHASVHYGKGMPSAHCSICAHYVKPDAKSQEPHCKLVRDPIKPRDWCLKFVKA